MSDATPHAPEHAASLRVFASELAASLPFREDGALLQGLSAELAPVLAALVRGYREVAAQEREATRRAVSEGFALFNLLCQRAGLLGATPTASLALGRALIAALKSEGLALSDAAVEDLMLVAVEGYSAGRDELRGRDLRALALAGQISCRLAPGCHVLFLSGSHLCEPFERHLSERARELFRAQARSVLLDVSRLCEASEELARALVSFAITLTELGIAVWLYEPTPRFDGWLARFALGAHGVGQERDFGRALTRALSRAGYELRSRGRFGELLDRVRTGSR